MMTPSPPSSREEGPFRCRRVPSLRRPLRTEIRTRRVPGILPLLCIRVPGRAGGPTRGSRYSRPRHPLKAVPGHSKLPLGHTIETGNWLLLECPCRSAGVKQSDPNRDAYGQRIETDPVFFLSISPRRGRFFDPDTGDCAIHFSCYSVSSSISGTLYPNSFIRTFLNPVAHEDA